MGFSKSCNILTGRNQGNVDPCAYFVNAHPVEGMSTCHLIIAMWNLSLIDYYRIVTNSSYDETAANLIKELKYLSVEVMFA